MNADLKDGRLCGNLCHLRIKKILTAFFVAAAILAPVPGWAMFVEPQLAPVDRLLKAAQTYLAAHPAEADAHYTLARIHYLAFARGAQNVPAIREADENGKPLIPGDWMADFDLYEARQRRAEELALQDIGEHGPKPPTEKSSAFEEARGKRARELEEHNWHPRGDMPGPALIAHASAALAEFREAIRLDPKNGLYVLGLASLTEQFADWASVQKPPNLSVDLRGLITVVARDTYLRAFRLAITGDAALPTLPVTGLPSLVSHEAGLAYVRIVEREHVKLRPPEKAALAEVKAGLKKLKLLRIGAITPIVFSLRKTSHLRALLAPHRVVDFDLRGFGPRRRWPWVKADTAFLVWDPQGNGAIASGRQLFGNYTCEIFRRNGYAALAALDANGDGQLAGGELHGIRVWIDANGNGCAEPEEVHDLAEFGIVAISTRLAGHDGIHPMNRQGLTLKDGRMLPTWDWIVAPRR